MDKHEKMNKMLVDFALGELSPQAQADLRIHLDECPQCEGEFKRLEALLECTGRMRELSADPEACESAERAILEAVENQNMRRQTAGVSIGLEWRMTTNNRVKLVAAVAIVIVLLGGVTFWPGGNSQNGKWWLGPPAVWGREMLAVLDATKAVTCREQFVRVMPDGSERTSGNWHIHFESSDSYRRDIYYKDVLVETQWYVPDGDGILQHSVNFELKSYFTSSHRGGFVDSDPVDRMRFYVGLIDEADGLLGEKIIDGVNCVGFEISASKYGDYPEERVNCIWFNIETKLPVRIEHHGISVSVAGRHADWTETLIRDQFDYDPDLPADTFVPRIPKGFIYGHPEEILSTREKERKE